MRTKFVKGTGKCADDCAKCCFSAGSWETCSYPNDKKCRCVEGYLVKVKPRRSNDRALLEQIAVQGIIMGGGTIALPNKLIAKLLDIRKRVGK